jgi:sortase A
MQSTHMKYVANIFIAVGLLALGYWTFEFARARLFQSREQRHFVSEPKSESVHTSRSKSPQPALHTHPSQGSAVATLVIPRLEVSLIVVEGANERELKLGPGHISGTALPGDGGNFGVAGHRDSFFRPLRLVRKNDAIKVITREREYQYKITSTAIVAPRDI